MPERARVALLVHTASDWSRSVLQGVAEFSRRHGPWEVFVEARGFQERPRLPRGWKGDGIIARLTDPQLQRSIRLASLPAVNVSWLGRHTTSTPQVVSDQEACGRLAAEHFLERGYAQYAYVGPLQHLGYEDQLGQRFAQSLAEAGHECEQFLPGSPTRRTSVYAQRQKLQQWLLRLPRRVALLAWNSEVGREVATLCHSNGLRVPEDIALLCVEHDGLMSDLSPTSLSSIDQSPGDVGYAAAELLQKMMNGAPAPDQPILIPPAGVVQRRSSEHYAVSDAIVAKALELIDQECDGPLKVGDLSDRLSISRRNLELRFHAAVSCAPAEQIRRIRLERAKRLLLESTLTVAQVAEKTGFQGSEVFIRNFKNKFSMPPGEYRSEFKAD